MAAKKISMKIDASDYYKATVNCRSSFNSLTLIKDKLSPAALYLFRKWCFGSFLDLEKINISGHLLHHILLRMCATSDHALWFDFGGSDFRFSMAEFAIMTGLNCNEYVKVDTKNMDGANDGRRVVDKYLGGRTKCSTLNLHRIFCDSKAEDDESMARFSMLYFLESCLMGKELRNCCPEELFLMVDNIDSFNRYPWGRLCFEATIGSMKEAMMRLRDIIDSCKGIKPQRYTLHGFPYALQIWAYETIGVLASNFGRKSSHIQIPRILNWKTPKLIKEKELRDVFGRDLGMCKRLVPDLPVEREADYLRFFSDDRWRSLYGNDIVGDTQFRTTIGQQRHFGDIPAVAPLRTTSVNVFDDADMPNIPQQTFSGYRPSVPPYEQFYSRRRFSRSTTNNISSDKYAELLSSLQLLHAQHDQLLARQEKVDQLLPLHEKVDTMQTKVDAMQAKVDAMQEKVDAMLEKVNQILEKQDKVDDLFTMKNQVYQIFQMLKERATTHATDQVALDGVDFRHSADFHDVLLASPCAEHVTKVGQRADAENIEAALSDAEDELPLEQHRDFKREETPDMPIVPPMTEEGSFASSVHMYTSPEVKKVGLHGLKRKRMPSKYMRTPFMNPVVRVRRVLPYNPESFADTDDNNALQNWLNEDNVVEPYFVDLKWIRLDREFFRSLRRPTFWLKDEHIDAAMWAMRRDVLENHGVVPIQSAIMDCLWSTMVGTVYSEWKDFPHTFWVNDSVFEPYARGLTLYDGIPWSDASKVYFPINLGENHWALGEVSFAHSKIYVYDSMMKLYSDTFVQAHMEPYAQMIPWLVNRLGVNALGSKKIEDDTNIEKWPVVRVKQILQQENGHDCGVFVLRFLELLLHGLELKDHCRQQWITYERERLSVKIWGYRNW